MSLQFTPEISSMFNSLLKLKPKSNPNPVLIEAKPANRLLEGESMSLLLELCKDKPAQYLPRITQEMVLKEIGKGRQGEMRNLAKVMFGLSIPRTADTSHDIDRLKQSCGIYQAITHNGNFKFFPDLARGTWAEKLNAAMRLPDISTNVEIMQLYQPDNAIVASLGIKSAETGMSGIRISTVSDYKEIFKSFEKRLDNAKSRLDNDPYRLMLERIHSQSDVFEASINSLRNKHVY